MDLHMCSHPGSAQTQRLDQRKEESSEPEEGATFLDRRQWAQQTQNCLYERRRVRGKLVELNAQEAQTKWRHFDHWDVYEWEGEAESQVPIDAGAKAAITYLEG